MILQAGSTARSLRLDPPQALCFLLSRLSSSLSPPSSAPLSPSPSRSRATNEFVLVAVMDVLHNWECPAAAAAAAADSKTYPTSPPPYQIRA